MFDQRKAAARVLAVNHEAVANRRCGAQDIAVPWSDYPHLDPDPIARSLARMLRVMCSSCDYSRCQDAAASGYYPLDNSSMPWKIFLVIRVV